jgi:hypothetical protein
MRSPFNAEEIQNVPEESGIYCLFQEQDLVYVGRTAPRSTLKRELEHALRLSMADEEMEATHFDFEPTKTPKTRATEELRSFYETFGRLPLYNQPQSSSLKQGAELRR